MARILEIARIPALYTHQAEGIQKVLEGQHLAIATPTASGKTLVYNAPVLTTLLDDPEAHALYVFPLKALEQDQFDELSGLMQGLGGTLQAAIYDGDTTSHRRRQIRNKPTAGAVHHAGHAALGHPRLPRGLGRFFRSPALRGHRRVARVQRRCFGSHVLHLFRRLNRICAHYGSRPGVHHQFGDDGQSPRIGGRVAQPLLLRD